MRSQLPIVWASSVGTKTCNVLIMFIIGFQSVLSHFLFWSIFYPWWLNLEMNPKDLSV